MTGVHLLSSDSRALVRLDVRSQGGPGAGGRHGGEVSLQNLEAEHQCGGGQIRERGHSSCLVRAEGLEPTLLAEQEPKSCASASFATPARVVRATGYGLPMIKVSVYYPSSEGSTFDHDYYRTTHVPLAAKAWNPTSTVIDKGVNGPYVAAVHMTFDSMEAMGAALGSPLTAEVQADVPNYTNIVPVMQISEIVDG